MPFVEWTEDLSVGVKEIDDQHKKLFDMMNSFYDIDLDKDREEGAGILSEFIEFVRVHFTTEEDFFEQCAYPDAEDHIKEHKKYTERVLRFQRDYASGKYDSSVFLGLLGDWWNVHLKTMDRGYIENFHDCGLR